MNKVKLVVWDFDLTLTRIHTFKNGILTNSHVDMLTSDYVRDDIFADFTFFKETVQKLLDNGIKVGITSFQYDNVIISLLDKAYGFNEDEEDTKRHFNFDNVLGRYFVVRNKLDMIKHLAKSVDSIEGEIWYFDDDVDNIKSLETYTSPHSTIRAFLVDEKVNFVRSEYEELMNKITIN